MTRLAFMIFVFGVLATSTARGEPAVAHEGHTEAREAFEAGMAAVEQRHWDEAVEHFERSLHARPTAVAHYNRALCLARLGRFDGALEAFESYLRLYEGEVDDRRRSEVQAEIQRLERRVGQVLIRLVGIAEADLSVDGEPAGRLPRQEPLFLLPGSHTLEIRGEEEGAPLTLTISVSAGSNETIQVELPTAPEVGSIDLHVRPVGAVVYIDGEQVGTSPLDAPILASEGRHNIEVRRQGYEVERAEVLVSASETNVVALRLGVREPLPPELSGRLAVDVSPRGGLVVVDGSVWEGAPVPVGPHEVEVQLDGFEIWRDEVLVVRSEVLDLQIHLVPTEARQEEQESRARSLRSLGWIALGVFGASFATSLGLYLWNDGRFDDWQLESRALEDLTAADRDRRLATNADLLESIHAGDAVVWAVVGLGAVALATSVALLVIGYRRARQLRQAARTIRAPE